MLQQAESIIDTAELYAKEDPKRLEIVRRYRSLIRRWTQERDLNVAKWYTDRGISEAARIYFAETEKRDPSSK